MAYFTIAELKSYLMIDGTFLDAKLQSITDRVNYEVSTETSSEFNAILKNSALRYAEYLYLKSPGVKSEKEADESRRYSDKELEVSDFIPDSYKTTTSEDKPRAYSIPINKRY